MTFADDGLLGRQGVCTRWPDDTQIVSAAALGCSSREVSAHSDAQTNHEIGQDPDKTGHAGVMFAQLATVDTRG